MLQTRIFSYADTQRHRLGPNYLLLPANAPKCPFHNNHHDGFMNLTHRDEEARHLPASLTDTHRLAGFTSGEVVISRVHLVGP